MHGRRSRLTRRRSVVLRPRLPNSGYLSPSTCGGCWHKTSISRSLRPISQSFSISARLMSRPTSLVTRTGWSATPSGRSIWAIWVANRGGRFRGLSLRARAGQSIRSIAVTPPTESSANHITALKVSAGEEGGEVGYREVRQPSWGVIAEVSPAHLPKRPKARPSCRCSLARPPSNPSEPGVGIGSRFSGL